MRLVGALSSVKVVSFLMLLLVAFSTACSDKEDPTDPEGAYNLFRQAMFNGDAEGVWNRLSPSTHQYFEEQYNRLVEMDATIERYLPQTDHKLARQQAGSILTDDVKNGKSLFLKLFRPDQLQIEESHRIGANVEEIQISEDKKFAQITTLGGQQFVLTKGENEQWYVMLVRSSKEVAQQMKWLEQNQSALQQTVEDLMAEERKEREAIIAELMNVE